MPFMFDGRTMLLLPLVWFGIVIYFVLRFLRAFERGVDAHERIARELGRLGREPERERGPPPEPAGMVGNTRPRQRG